MGATEQVGKVATGVVEGLKSQPLSLALIVLNIVFVLFVGWLLYALNERTVEQYRQKDTQTNVLLAKLDSIAEVRNDVTKIGEKLQTLILAQGQAFEAIDRHGKTLDDHERRIRDLEKK